MKNHSDRELLKELEKRLISSKRSLIEYQELTSQLKSVNQKLMESEGLKSHFLSNMTNEIVNPFSSILGLAKNIMTLKENEWDRVKSMASLIHSEAFDLDFQLNNIFAAAKIEAGELIPSVLNVDVNSLFESVINAFKYKAMQKELAIKFTYEIKSEKKERKYFKTDPERLKLVISNILSNSIKFSNAASEIIINVLYTNGDLKIIIKDFGIGMKKEDMKIIFDRFKKIDHTINSVTPGHGLGLSVVKSVLDMLGGDINITSKPNKGTKFDILIPEAHSDIDIEGFATDDNEFFFDSEETF